MAERLCLNLNEIPDPVVSDIVGSSLPTRLMWVHIGWAGSSSTYRSKKKL